MDLIKGMDIRVVAATGSQLGEGPIWHAAERAVYWVDILGHRVYRYDAVTERVEVAPTPVYPSAVVPMFPGDLLLAVQGGVGSFSFKEAKFSMRYPIEQHRDDLRCNDGKCDPAGRFWVGTMALDECAGSGSVYRLEAASRHATRVIDGVTISNGMAWDTNRALFYYIDTPTRRVVAYHYDPATGAIHHPRPVITIYEREGWPDGMTIDSEGKLWIALWGGWAVVRFDPDTGRKLAEVKLPVAQPTSCAFGGEGLDTLYITSARKGLSKQAIEDQLLAGALFAIDGLGVKGKNDYYYINNE